MDSDDAPSLAWQIGERARRARAAQREVERVARLPLRADVSGLLDISTSTAATVAVLRDRLTRMPNSVSERAVAFDADMAYEVTCSVEMVAAFGVDRGKVRLLPDWTTRLRRHLWYRTEDGDIDTSAVDADIHNGPECTVCGYYFCVSCTPNGWETVCPGSEVEAG